MRYLVYLPLLLTLNVLDAQSQQAPPTPIEAYLEALEEAETNFGAYDESIADIYIGLGNAYRQINDYDGASTAYLRGMQVQRVNYGLYDIGQISYLEMLTDVAKIQGNWNVAAKYLKQAYAIQSYHYKPGDEGMSKVLLARMDLHLLAYSQLRRTEAGFRHLTRAHHVDVRDAKAYLPDPSTNLEEFLAIRGRSVVINYEMALLSVSKEVRPKMHFSSNSKIEESTHNDVVTYYIRGRDGINSMIEALENYSGDPLRIAGAYTDLADWYLLFDKTSSAIKHYKKAYSLVESQEGGEKLALKLYAQPVMLPHYGISVPAEKKSHKGTVPLKYSLTVNKFGKPSSIKLLESPEGMSVSALRRGKAYLRSSRFRPVISEQGVQSSKGYNISIFMKKG